VLLQQQLPVNQSMALISSRHTKLTVKAPEGMVNCVPVAPQGVWL
jgi:hypothetical protein